MQLSDGILQAGFDASVDKEATGQPKSGNQQTRTSQITHLQTCPVSQHRIPIVISF